MSSEGLKPRDAADLAEIIRTHPRALEPIGGGSKRTLGRPLDADPLDLSGLAGMVSYEPAELVLSARCGTRLAEIEAALRAHGQRLAFEPPDFGALLGVEAPQTLGGVLAANLAGSRRLVGGAARDHFLGVTAVDGHGERFKAGGEVVKNVTGYDLPKLLAGSWGTLAVLIEVTIRVAPAPEVEQTLVVRARDAAHAVEILTAASGSAFEVSSAAFDPARGCLLRLEGFVASVRSRAAAVCELVAPADVATLDDAQSRGLWRDVGGATDFANELVVWRISVPPSDAPRVLAAIEPQRYLLDWAGGLIWAAYADVDAVRVRGALRDGHATLLKAPPAARAAISTFQPQPAALAAIAARVKAAFDPHNRLCPGRLS
jgi:glycolate oxidase FAD binding subunit